METHMSDERDVDLADLFDRSRPTLDGGAFVKSLIASMEAQRHKVRRARVAALIVALALLTAIGPRLVSLGVEAARITQDLVTSYGWVMVSPAGWVVSSLIGLAVILRARPRLR
jgi:hypothetical protein